MTGDILMADPRELGGEIGPVEQISNALTAAGLKSVRLVDLEWAAIRLALDETSSNRTHAASLLGVSVRTLQRKLKARALEETEDGRAEFN